MTKPAKTVAQQAQLQGLVGELLESYRAQRPGLTSEDVFELLVATAWSYGRDAGSSTEEIVNRMRAHSMACEVARTHAVDVLERNGAVRQ